MSPRKHSSHRLALYLFAGMISFVLSCDAGPTKTGGGGYEQSYDSNNGQYTSNDGGCS